MTVFRWTVVLAGLSALALGCAPGTTPPAGARENTVDLVAGRGARTMTIERDDPTRAGRLSVPPDQAWTPWSERTRCWRSRWTRT